MIRRPPRSTRTDTLFPYTTRFRSDARQFVTPLGLDGRPTEAYATTKLDNDYWLPAATLTWNMAEDMQLRLAASKTRSEEHTSELQSLMRISYAVFCLKKKNKNNKK